MGKLRILFLCPQPLWPANTGARLRNFHLANALSQDCEVTVLQVKAAGEAVSPEPASAFQQVLSATRDKSYTPWKIVRGLAGPVPLTVLNYSSRNVGRVLEQTLEAAPFDVVQLESIHLFGYLEIIRRARSAPATVLDWHNIESELMQRYAEDASNLAKKLVASRTAGLLFKLEQQALRSFSVHTVVSEREKEKLLKRAPEARVAVIPNGVDSDAFANPERPAQPNGRFTLLFVGSMDYHANSDAVLWFCREIWPGLAAEFPKLDFKIVGRNPPPPVQGLASPRIFVTGTVEDVKPFYREACAVVVPLRMGGGTRLKILEAMAAGVPVISTCLGAEGIDGIQDRQEIFLSDSPAAMSESLRELLGMPQTAQKVSDAARTLVRRQYDWSVIGCALAELHASLRH